MVERKLFWELFLSLPTSLPIRLGPERGENPLPPTPRLQKAGSRKVQELPRCPGTCHPRSKEPHRPHASFPRAQALGSFRLTDVASRALQEMTEMKMKLTGSKIYMKLQN